MFRCSEMFLCSFCVQYANNDKAPWIYVRSRRVLLTSSLPIYVSTVEIVGRLVADIWRSIFIAYRCRYHIKNYFRQCFRREFDHNSNPMFLDRLRLEGMKSEEKKGDEEIRRDCDQLRDLSKC